ncbi:MAG: M56 family metallopeptidase [Bacteroidota bacterium]
MLEPLFLSASAEQRNTLRSFSFFHGFWLLGSTFAAIRLAYGLVKIFKLRKRAFTSKLGDLMVYELSEKLSPFSFFQWIFIWQDIQGEARTQILSHEKVHVKQWHSLDKLFFELMKVVFWMNPLVYFYSRRLSEIHEFLADQGALSENGPKQYQQLLNSVFNTQNIFLVNQFYNSSLIKKRIVMLTKENSKRTLKLKYLLILPLVFAMLAYVSCIDETEPPSEVAPEATTLTTSEQKEAVPFMVVENPPIFPGCENAEDKRACFQFNLQNHVRENFTYPKEALENDIDGMVANLFKVSVTGEITDVTSEGPSEILEEEAVRIISKLPKMTPAMQDGKPVEIVFSFPISFVLE